ncbi:hypothetical protein GLOIN_2v634084 [Rhizophagus irregularis DAOM 181602=DAOM 197198]|uniref:Uncharacterized protein n=1 Tax=Rhizophagus irregularis (strain DAOM 181602 / DAOM 197198 / MUCL 43194) TaxID=747089 RepID=A0A2P4PAD2_RHIID|nr:hypothetical protein GLOIN_2v634084 [Rhizophagus irregularis DAOM 181602=DAOM 197198]POG62321.1 hypothetical protein GLOIN_2v634084 [Rhizophagus irregularis DAOM 181602=DAOM 197198]|eukprot:XP_025169187.1 hypothetical protein GLOIN_2v634084 [Rhizophagus irregularis DAOM 181602=DAOM 197198]
MNCCFMKNSLLIIVFTAPESTIAIVMVGFLQPSRFCDDKSSVGDMLLLRTSLLSTVVSLEAIVKQFSLYIKLLNIHCLNYMIMKNIKVVKGSWGRNFSITTYLSLLLIFDGFSRASSAFD